MAAEKASRYDGMSTVWKFGYGSNMGQNFLREKKALNPLKSAPCVLRGYSLSFPLGRGLDYVEPSFASIKVNPLDSIHGVATLFPIEDADKLNKQESAYDIIVSKVILYDGSELDVEIYAPLKPIPLDFPEGVCSKRYRDILVAGAKEAKLDDTWVEKLQRLPVYTPSDETLALRARLPPPSALPQMSIEELALHNGDKDSHPHYISSLGYIFQVKDAFKVFHGRDITFRNVLHSRGVNLDANDDGGKSPFPRLSKLEPPALEYALHYRDRYLHKSGGAPVAVLREFWEQQEVRSTKLPIVRDSSFLFFLMCTRVECSAKCCVSSFLIAP